MLGPLVAFAVMTWGHAGIRTIFWLAAIPAALAMVVLVGVVRDVPRRSAPGAPARTALIASVVPVTGDDPVSSLPHGFWWYLGVVLLFTLGNSTDAFLLLRAQQLGVPTVLAPVLWALLSGVKALTSTHGGALSDRLGRRPMIVAGWVWYAIVYFAFARADAAWQVWGLFAIYGIFYGMTEGAEKALVVDLVPRARIGTALGWYNLAIGIGALPASVLFGIVWDRAGASAAFVMGAGLAMMAVLGLVVFVDRGSA
jgi:MFS family permease